ncbi:Chaperone protein dnaJ, partial [Coemansia sp. RSA 1694]
MEVNRDEAARALDIAQKKWLAGDIAGALRVARKSHSLYPTALSKSLIAEYGTNNNKQQPQQQTPSQQQQQQKQQQQQPGNEESELRSRTTTTTTSSSSTDNQRTHTPQQLASVRAVISAKHDYYKVLGVERTATDPELKRAYRRSALLFHPDKNFAPGADEAFKLVAHAFTILSDPDKRAHYDRYGVADKSSDYATTSSSSHHQQQYSRHRRAEDEISPEDLFNMFFGGGSGNAGGGRFGVQFGPNVRFAQHFQANPNLRQNQYRQRQTDDEGERSMWSACMQFMPLVFLVLSFFGSSILSLIFGGNVMPNYAFDMSPPYTQLRHTHARNVQYWVDPAEFGRSYLAASIDAANSRDLRYFEREVEAQYVSRLQRR